MQIKGGAQRQQRRNVAVNQCHGYMEEQQKGSKKGCHGGDFPVLKELHRDLIQQKERSQNADQVEELVGGIIAFSKQQIDQLPVGDIADLEGIDVQVTAFIRQLGKITPHEGVDDIDIQGSRIVDGKTSHAEDQE